jgi:CubicO group peptidase (beta-lactamase class C family)
MMRSILINILIVFLLVCIFSCTGESADEPVLGDITSLLEKVRAEYELPAMAGAVISRGEIIAIDAVGVRKAGSDVKVTIDDKFHLGSCTKAMTATIIGILVEQGKLRWDVKLREALPDLAEDMLGEYQDMTLRHLIEHRAGLAGRDASWPKGKSYMDLHKLPGTARQQRKAYVKMMLSQEPAVKPGTKYHYSNAGYSVAGVIVEEVTDTEWEELICKMLFEPLGMKTVGFGAMGSAGKIEQPWQHRKRRGKVVPIEPGPFSDNPAVIGPGGTVHCSLSDWAKFVILHLEGEYEGKRLMSEATLQSLHEPLLGGEYAGGWLVTERDWAGGKALNHRGSNLKNYAVVWMSPEKRYAVLVVTNIAGKGVEEACDDAVSGLISMYPPVETE